VRYCLAHAPVAPPVAEVAAALGVTRKTVAARLAAEALPPASALVGWGRVLLAARCLEDAHRSAEHVVHALGFADTTGLRHLLTRYTGLRTEQVRARGGLSAVLPMFAATLHAGHNGLRTVGGATGCAGGDAGRGGVSAPPPQREAAPTATLR